MILTTESFRPAPYLRNGHLQTIFREYSLLKDAVKDLPVPTTIITAKDDPIMPVADFYQLELNHHTNLVVHAFGGHNGFIDGFFLKSWYEQKLADMFDKIILNGK